MSHDYDLAVIGGGPGGCAAAIAAADRGLRVVLFEPSELRDPKPCGEGVMPSGVAALDALGLGGVRDEARPFFGLRYRVPGARPLELELATPGLALPRARLQAALSREVARRSEIERVAAKASSRPARGGCEVVSEGTRLRVGCVAAADGLGGSSTPRERRRRPAHPRFGLRAHFAAGAALDRVEIHFGRAAEVYLTPLPDGVVNAAVLLSDPAPGPGGAQRWLTDALALHPDARCLLGRQLTRAAARRLSCGSVRRVATARHLLVGDAGGGVDPVVGCGLTVALRSGIAAARAARELADGAAPPGVMRRYARTYRAETRARRALAAALAWLGERDALARGALGSARAMPALARRLVAVASGTDGDTEAA